MSTEIQERNAKCRKLDAIGWGVFFVWMGLTMLIKLPDGIATLGIGIIILGEAIARVVTSVSVNKFWILLGVIFIGAGIGEMFAVNLPLLPIAFLVAGALLIMRQTTKTKKAETDE